MTIVNDIIFSVKNLSKSYSSPEGSLEILRNINFEIQAGSFNAIVGESGSGKSTLLQILGTLDSADSGSISLNGKQIDELKSSELASIRNKQIGFVYQSHHLIPELTAVENVMLPLLIRGENQESSKVKASALLNKLHLGERLHHSPAQLSGGEAQRVAVARAIVTQPKLILADEPTGNLDEATAQSVFQLMHDLCKSENIAFVMVTHSRSFANACDNVFELSQHTLSLLNPEKTLTKQ